ncbi:MAG TPA: ABC transporter ATP-binding protein [Planctomycetota bacterium]|jgi:putative ABC transport system ATP-binding protein|nr:ABC transporter ATP-binding protein [Planctomycetota bacterium]OQC22108.1 MAG: Macrolide export ATP-binding/permease protein MacB [Planctomycetes bacterium ADurb.Bin069]HNR98009.1 ABC transporter ATP-binding protein [Planctomycetota bacterium]HOE28688.1 ABC transporter ATP-binding protein [Planctomycetota bacterium]HOE85553.1 ABC transporter ATP-binding protein [Planctomycetota bacterium]
MTRAAAGGGAGSRNGAIVSIERLSKIYRLGGGEVRALDAVSLAIPEGEFVAIMGASGSGKSTLLNILGCLDRPTEGAYYLGGEDVSKLGDNALSMRRCRFLGFVFQSYNLIPQLTVLENIEIPLFYQGLLPRACRERSRVLAERVGLADRLDHRPTELSGGQQQRVAVARALANDPLVILADEPTGNLDSRTGEEIMDLILGLHRQGKTIILVTHDAKVATHAQRIIRLADGIIIADERREEGPDVVA